MGVPSAVESAREEIPVFGEVVWVRPSGYSDCWRAAFRGVRLSGNPIRFRPFLFCQTADYFGGKSLSTRLSAAGDPLGYEVA